MTDKEKLERLLKEFGLEYKYVDEVEMIFKESTGDFSIKKESANHIYVYPDNNKYDSYCFLEFNFDEKGKFIKLMGHE